MTLNTCLVFNGGGGVLSHLISVPARTHPLSNGPACFLLHLFLFSVGVCALASQVYVVLQKESIHDVLCRNIGNISVLP